MTTASATPRETIAVFDLDGTLTTRDTTAAYLMGYIRQHPRRLPRCLPLIPAVAAFAGGLVDNDRMKRAALGAVLGGIDRASVGAWTARFVPWCLRTLLRPLARARIAEHARAGHRLMLATASLDLHAVPIARALGLLEVICTKVAWTADGRISGELDGDNIRDDRKLAAVQRAVLLTERAPRSAMVIAYSDHHADLPLLRWADQAVAVNPTRRLAAAARIEAIPIEDWGRS